MNATPYAVRTRRLCALALLLTLIVTESIQAQDAPNDTLTLDEVIGEVLHRNDRLAAARYMEEAAGRNASAQGVWDDPMLMLGLQNAPTNFDLEMDPMTMKMIGLSQTIPYSGYNGLLRQSAQADARAATEQRRAAEIDLVAAARTAYYDVYFLQRSVSDLEIQHEILGQIAASTTARLRSNQAGQDEVLTAQADIWRIESTLRSTWQEFDAALFRLNSLRGSAVDTPVVLAAVPHATLPDSAAAWIMAAEENYPPLRQLQEVAESYAFSAQASRRMAWPMLSVEAAYGFRSGVDLDPMGMEEKRDNMISLQANISLPIFSRGKQRAMAGSMEAMRRSTEAESTQLRRDIHAELNTLHQRARRLQESVYAYRNQIIPATEDAYRTALAGYTANRTSFTALSNYTLALYRDRITANQLENELARTLTEAERYVRGTAEWTRTVVER